ncbi:hypothetical protein GIB67_008919, partial [Kingdonia uniflora]
NLRKKTQETSLELSPRFISFLSLTLSYSIEAFNVYSLFIGFPLGHLQNMHHKIIHCFGSNPLQNELRNKQTVAIFARTTLEVDRTTSTETLSFERLPGS